MPIIDENPDEEPRRLGFLLVDGFALLSYASVIEPFRAANMMTGQSLYRWSHISIDGGPCRASTGAYIEADAKMGDRIDIDILFVVVGGDPSTFEDKALFAWLRQLARTGIVVAGVAGGPFLLAKAGLLEGHRCTIHWDLIPGLQERFPRLMLEHSLYVIDRRRLTCAGGSAGLDLAIDVIERNHGHSLAVKVSDWFVRTQYRPPYEPQRTSLRERYGISNDAVLKALATMEANVEEPMRMDELCAAIGICQRRLERHFRAHLGTTATAMYRHIRLEQAAVLLRKTAMSVTEVAAATGFGSISSLSAGFRQRYGVSPRSFRAGRSEIRAQAFGTRVHGPGVH